MPSVDEDVVRIVSQFLSERRCWLDKKYCTSIYTDFLADTAFRSAGVEDGSEINWLLNKARDGHRAAGVAALRTYDALERLELPILANLSEFKVSPRPVYRKQPESILRDRLIINAVRLATDLGLPRDQNPLSSPRPTAFNVVAEALNALGENVGIEAIRKTWKRQQKRWWRTRATAIEYKIENYLAYETLGTFIPWYSRNLFVPTTSPGSTVYRRRG